MRCLEWIGDPEKYQLYCDENLQLLKMEIYTGHIPHGLQKKTENDLRPNGGEKSLPNLKSEGEQGLFRTRFHKDIQ